jgi:transcriptional regulator with XRE-family HTH domain
MEMTARLSRRRELAEFLRSRRAKVSPAEVGLPDAGLRRTPGLRREEVAMLAGVGVTWYTWLEQGREINPSDEVLASIARTLRLSSSETDHVSKLAREQPPASSPVEVPAVLKRLVESQSPAPAMLMDARWDLLAWNRDFEAIFEFDGTATEERNAAWLMFAWPRVREVLEDWPTHARRVLGAFRAASADLLADTRFLTVLERLRAEHPEVRAWWHDQEVGPKTVSTKVLRHPVHGRMAVEEVMLRPAVAPELQLVINLPVSPP